MSRLSSAAFPDKLNNRGLVGQKIQPGADVCDRKIRPFIASQFTERVSEEMVAMEWGVLQF